MLPVWRFLVFDVFMVLYFMVQEASEKWPVPSIKLCFFKVLPILHLLLILFTTPGGDNQVPSKSSSYRKRIFVGLIFSIGGDIALVYKENYFELGMMSFGVAHICYILAFGCRPLGRVPMVATFAVVSGAMYVYIVTDLNESLAFKIGILVYALLIASMAWRATVQFTESSLNLENFCGCAGGLLFVLSDSCLAIDKWKGSFYLAPLVIMSTYYLGQLGITLSGCNTLPAKSDQSGGRKNE